MPIKESELILNPDNSIYHLNLKPEHVAKTIILVGDQDRVEKVSKYFDRIEFKIQKREFKTHTGYYKKKRITVISTGIGPDNIDIVLNELDALVNIDFGTRQIKETLTKLHIIRIGTSGSLQAHIPVDTFVLSTHGLDINGMLHAYQLNNINTPDFEQAFITHTNWSPNKARPIIIEGSQILRDQLKSEQTYEGLTATAGGFYGPQGRVLRLPVQDAQLNSKMDNFEYNNIRISNFEMETSAIFGLAKLLGHEALSLNAIIANRATGNFTKKPALTIDKLIKYTLDKLVE
ncbi:nucleoside phosphorylase [Tamlana fucoidanivorans]|uniref:Uridine phosphorylase n=1 Tax=Allotamlana fucoidanivorans TaxID=2583814 RepID=A0A5C4SEF4_9FLAO|nr:nucleoside phosphorylase [Tamlana fucoidanivorans]TNJ41691.1 phosphorylase [Tamlana fucoidanivorans]